jgi:hypothetical protein
MDADWCQPLQLPTGAELRHGRFDNVSPVRRPCKAPRHRWVG